MVRNFIYGESKLFLKVLPVYFSLYFRYLGEELSNELIVRINSLLSALKIDLIYLLLRTLALYFGTLCRKLSL
jgi:hypothetical protein